MIFPLQPEDARVPFTVGDRMEAVDPFCPQLIRIAHVVLVQENEQQLQLRFDGWPVETGADFTVDANSWDIFPPRFCELSRTAIVLPPDCT